jgi:hypothetical protein
MGPKPTLPTSGDLYRSRLDQILDPRHELFRLAALIDWDRFDQEFGRFYLPMGRPAKPTRLMVGLSYLQHTFNLSDEAVVQRGLPHAGDPGVMLIQGWSWHQFGSRQQNLGCRWPVAQGRVRPHRVVVPAPTLDDHLRLVQGVEDCKHSACALL